MIGYPKNTGIKKKEKKSGIAKVSDKQKERIKLYQNSRLQYLADKNKCEVCFVSKDLEIHHIRGRQGDYLFDKENFLAVCRTCHIKIESNPNWAREKGYIKSRL
jgi:hypothetical protein